MKLFKLYFIFYIQSVYSNFVNKFLENFLISQIFLFKIPRKKDFFQIFLDSTF